MGTKVIGSFGGVLVALAAFFVLFFVTSAFLEVFRNDFFKLLYPLSVLFAAWSSGYALFALLAVPIRLFIHLLVALECLSIFILLFVPAYWPPNPLSLDLVCMAAALYGPYRGAAFALRRKSGGLG